VKSASSGDYVDTDGVGGESTRSADASNDDSTEADAYDGNADRKPLPALNTDLFVAAGAVVAGRITREGTEPSQVEEVLGRVVAQCFALTR